MHAKIICKMWRQIFEMNAKRQINDRRTAGQLNRRRSRSIRQGSGQDMQKCVEKFSELAVFIAQISEMETEVHLGWKKDSRL